MIGVVGSDAKAQAVKDAGAEVVLVRDADDIVGGVKAATGGHGADVVFDPVGGEAFDSSTKCIAFEGRIIVVGFAGGTIQTLSAGLATLQSANAVRYDLLMAGAVIASVPVCQRNSSAVFSGVQSHQPVARP